MILAINNGFRNLNCISRSYTAVFGVPPLNILNHMIIPNAILRFQLPRYLCTTYAAISGGSTSCCFNDWCIYSRTWPPLLHSTTPGIPSTSKSQVLRSCGCMAQRAQANLVLRGLSQSGATNRNCSWLHSSSSARIRRETASGISSLRLHTMLHKTFRKFDQASNTPIHTFSPKPSTSQMLRLVLEPLTRNWQPVYATSNVHREIHVDCHLPSCSHPYSTET